MSSITYASPAAPTVARALVRRCSGRRRARPAAGRPAPLAISAARAQALPDLGDESQSLVSPVQERKLGESVVRQIRGAGAYLDDPEVNDYLNELGQRLVLAVPDTTQGFEFFAVADPSINAFALPGGYVGVNMGLILLTQTESELAAVLAHEITHVTQHHFTRSMAGQQRSILYSLAALAVAIAASRSSSSSAGQAANAAIASAQAISIQSQLNYTRENEYEADRIGFQRLDAAGFDDTAMASDDAATAEADTVCREQCAVVPAHAPDHLRTDRRGAGPRAGQAVPAGGRLARLPDGARAAEELRGDAAGGRRCSSTKRSRSTSSTTRSPRTTGSSPRSCVPTTRSARRSSSRCSRRWRRRTR